MTRSAPQGQVAMLLEDKENFAALFAARAPVRLPAYPHSRQSAGAAVSAQPGSDASVRT